MLDRMCVFNAGIGGVWWGAYKVTALQEYTHNKMREHGAEVHVCRSVEDTIKTLEEEK